MDFPGLVDYDDHVGEVGFIVRKPGVDSAVSNIGVPFEGLAGHLRIEEALAYGAEGGARGCEGDIDVVVGDDSEVEFGLRCDVDDSAGASVRAPVYGADDDLGAGDGVADQDACVAPE